MAGRPKLRQLTADIEAKGGPGYIFERLAEGASNQELSEEFGCSRWLLKDWREQDPEWQASWHAARRMSGEVQAERGLDILERVAKKGAFATAAEVSAAKAVAGYRRWLAGVRDPAYADKAAGGVNLNVTLQGLHLEALEKYGTYLDGQNVRDQVEAGRADDPIGLPSPVEDAEYEVVE